jgi:Mlc titration factor MtfA (ptsG expression regulator)
MPYDIVVKVLAGLVVLVCGLYSWNRMQRNLNRAKLLAAEIPGEWVDIINRKVPIYSKLPMDLRKQLGGLVNLFLAEKEFEGCEGLEITDEIRVTVAAQACILLLNRATRYYPKLKTIYIYPHTYVAKGEGNSGARLGESWQNGPVVLAWNSVTGGAQNMHDGKNVVFHEFSHRLDQEDGAADGAPILEDRSCYKTWASVLGQEYDALQDKTRRRRKSVINKYGATNPAEFFAVATEAFFEKPRQMHKKQPDLYEELKSYYKMDPLNWK